MKNFIFSAKNFRRSPLLEKSASRYAEAQRAAFTKRRGKQRRPATMQKEFQMESVKSGGAALIEPVSTGNAITRGVKGIDMDILIQSIRNHDIYIGVAAVVTAAFLALCLCLAWCVKEKCSKRLNFFVHLTNNIFVTLTSLFPQLGLFGTVMSLVNVKFDSLDLDNVLPQFFNALTSTAWGIIFFVVFSGAYALCSFFIEAKIEEGKRLVDAHEVKS